jgi:hypothetical protein
MPPEIGGEPYTVDVCPGAVARRPLVAACAAAWSAFDKGQLALLYPDPPGVPAVILQGVLALTRAANRRETQEIAAAHAPKE